jgi:5-(carboxyamino)imidazole ribonucleotide mutase
MGSDSDWDAMSRCHALLEEFGVASEVFVASAHRTPQKVHRLAESCEQGDVQVVIAAAGMANHLAGTMAALVSCPVIGVPMNGGTNDGMDALLYTAQKPPGVPVATVAVGSAGARNAAVLAAQILSVGDADLARRLAEWREGQAETVNEKDAELRRSIQS